MLDIEEISKLWTAFQTNYRISAAYSVSAVLIQNPLGAALRCRCSAWGPGRTTRDR